MSFSNSLSDYGVDESWGRTKSENIALITNEFNRNATKMVRITPKWIIHRYYSKSLKRTVEVTEYINGYLEIDVNPIG
jgi:hypothetical protein